MITRRGRFVGHIFAFLFCLWGGGQTTGKPIAEAVVLYTLVVLTGLALSFTVEMKWNEAELVRANRRALRGINDFSDFQRRVDRPMQRCKECGAPHPVVK